MTAVDVANVAVTFGADVRALRGVDASLEPGRLVGLIGPNGAGKTTLLRTINGILEPDRGSVTVGGDRVADLSARNLARRVATVPQVTSFSFDFDVRTIVEMGRNPYRSRLGAGDPAPETVDRALERTETTNLADRPLSAVSGGERQRVLFARALAQETPVLLLDEPTASLDIGHAARTLALVRNLATDGNRTVIAAIHDLDLAARYCDELLLLADGRIHASGSPANVLTADAVNEAFETPASVSTHPVTGTPLVTALPGGEPDSGSCASQSVPESRGADDSD